MKTTVVTLLAMLTGCVASGNNPHPARQPIAIGKPDAATLPVPDDNPRFKKTLSAAHLTANQMVQLMQSTGQFQYRFHLSEGQSNSPKYNLLRHAGAVYALHEYRKRFPDQRIDNVIQLAVAYLAQHVHSVSSNNRSAVWSPKIYRNDGRDVAKLGGTGLGLVAAVSCDCPDTEGSPGPEAMEQLGKFILFMQKKDGAFYSRYWLDTASRDDSWSSLYYPGEAALGLLYLHRTNPSGIWLTAAQKALLYLAETRKGQRTIPHDHWALIATSHLFQNSDAMQITEKNRRALMAHTIQVTKAIIDTQNRSQGSPVHGAFDDYGKTTPTATRLEGLIAAYRILSASKSELRHRILHAIEMGIDFLLRAQIKDGQYAGSIPRATTRMEANDATARKFNKRVEEVRIDYLQHALSAMLGYLEICEMTPTQESARR